MANQPAQHAPAHKAESKADVPYVVALTPEQHEARVRQAESQAAAKDAPPPAQIEMGGSATAKASFHDATDADCPILTSDWTSTGPIKVTPDDKDPTSAKLEPTGLGPATVTVTGQTDDGPAQASTSVVVIEKLGAPVGGTIEITVQAPDAKKAGPAAKPAAPAAHHAPAKP